MPHPSEPLVAEHRACDEAWAEVESLANDPAAAAQALKRFTDMTLAHFELEEQQLFPALEQAAGFPPHAGPTAVMRAEHAQCRTLLNEMALAAERGDWREVLDLGDTLLMLIQQHNLKEEQVLYPMADQVLPPGWPEGR